MGGNKRNAAGIDAWKGDSRLHRNDRLLHRKGFVRATTYSLLKPLDLLALAQPPHDVDGEDAALMTREQIIDKIANDRGTACAIFFSINRRVSRSSKAARPARP